MSNNGSNRMLTVKQLAEMLAVSPNTVYDKWREWGLPGYKIGKHLRFREGEVLAWVDEHRA